MGGGGLEVFTWVVNLSLALGVLNKYLGLVHRFLAGLLTFGLDRFQIGAIFPQNARQTALVDG